MGTVHTSLAARLNSPFTGSADFMCRGIKRQIMLGQKLAQVVLNVLQGLSLDID